MTNLAFVVAALAAEWRFQPTPDLAWHSGWDLCPQTGLLVAIASRL